VRRSDREGEPARFRPVVLTLQDFLQAGCDRDQISMGDAELVL
jgi:hypothetical protein